MRELKTKEIFKQLGSCQFFIFFFLCMMTCMLIRVFNITIFEPFVINIKTIACPYHTNSRTFLQDLYLKQNGRGEGGGLRKENLQTAQKMPVCVC